MSMQGTSGCQVSGWAVAKQLYFQRPTEPWKLDKEIEAREDRIHSFTQKMFTKYPSNTFLSPGKIAGNRAPHRALRWLQNPMWSCAFEWRGCCAQVTVTHSSLITECANSLLFHTWAGLSAQNFLSLFSYLQMHTHFRGLVDIPQKAPLSAKLSQLSLFFLSISLCFCHESIVSVCL